MMDLVSMLRIVRRRWYATWPVIVVALLMVPGVVSSTDPEYRATGSAVLLGSDPTSATPAAIPDPPPTDPAATEPAGTVPPPPNPYAEFTASETITAAVLADLSTSRPFHQRVEAAGGPGELTVTQETGLPLLTIEAEARTRQGAIDTVAAVVAVLATELDDRQARLDVPAERRTTIDPVSVPTTARRVQTARIRAIAVLVGAGLVGVVASAMLFESWARARAARRAAGGSASARHASNGDGVDRELLDPAAPAVAEPATTTRE